MNQTKDETLAAPEMTTTRLIPPPSGNREPLKVNVYEHMAKCAAQLVPIFPYDDAGSIVPCGAVMMGGPDQNHGHFFHANTVSEVITIFGSNESMLGTGQIMASQKFHGVNSYLKDEKNPDHFAVLTVTQHQSSDIGQNEAMVAKCESCKKEILRHGYASAPFGAPDFDPARFGDASDVFRQFSTQVGATEFAHLRNTDEVRTCSHCGHVNELFSTDPWGWPRLTAQTAVVNAAAHALHAAAQEGKNQ